MYQDSVSFVNVPSSADSNRRGLSSLLLLWLPPQARAVSVHVHDPFDMAKSYNLTFVLKHSLCSMLNFNRLCIFKKSPINCSLHTY